MATVGSKFLTSHAKRTGASRSGKIVIGAPPLRPAMMFVPGVLARVAERRDHADARQDDAAPSLLPQGHRYIPNPPSTASTAPVTKLDASEARKRTQRATSSGSPRRPSGVDASSASRALSGSTSVSSVAI